MSGVPGYKEGKLLGKNMSAHSVFDKNYFFLGIVELLNEEGAATSTGLAQSEAVYDQVKVWKVKVKKTKKILVFNPEEEERIKRFCVFALSYYIPTFFTSCWGCDAPSNDLKLYKELLAFKTIDATLATSALATLDRHRWYLAPSVVMFSLFSDKVSEDTKSRMAAKILSCKRPKEPRIDLPEFPAVTADSELWDFVQPSSWEFFDILQVEADWLTRPLVEWEDSEGYRKARQFVRTVKVVNDAAERGIKLASDYAKSLTKDTKMRQKIFQAVEYHRMVKPDVRKSTANK